MDNISAIHWFPGHMAKTRRVIKENLNMVDAVVEILDARIPFSSSNPEMNKLIGNKPKILLLNKSDMANSYSTQKWIEYFKSKSVTAISADCKSGAGLKSFLPVLKNDVLRSLLEKRNAKGMTGRPIRLMVLGIPNVGKSSFINKMAKSKCAKVEDRPGVTRSKQWVKLCDNVEMLDMPGVLWPKLEDQEAARKLAFTGAVKDHILDIESLAMLFLEMLSSEYSNQLKVRYKIEIVPGEDGKTLLEKIARKRRMLLNGGEADLERAAITVFDEFRGGKLGRITLETPDKIIS